MSEDNKKEVRSELLEKLEDELHEMIFAFEDKYECGVLVQRPKEFPKRFHLVSNIKAHYESEQSHHLSI